LFIIAEIVIHCFIDGTLLHTMAEVKLLPVLEITDDVVDKKPWIQERGLWKIPFHVLDSGSLLPRPYR
jgi:hypothetical protein